MKEVTHQGHGAGSGRAGVQAHLPIRPRECGRPWGWGGVRGAYLGPAATVYIGAHGVVGASPTHVQVCSVPGLDEPDEVPALTLGPEGKPGRYPDACPFPLPLWGRPPPAPPVDPAALTLPSLPESTHSSMRCGEAAQWICRRWGSEGAGRGHQPRGRSLIPPPHTWAGPYDEGLAVDVVQVQGQHVVLAAHVHAVVVLVFEQDSVVSRVEQEVEEVGSARSLQLCGQRAGRQLGPWEDAIQPSSLRQRVPPPHGHLNPPASPPGST